MANQNKDMGTGRGAVAHPRPGRGPGGRCICTRCKTTLPHRPGVPCSELKCPDCGGKMKRE